MVEYIEVVVGDILEDFDKAVEAYRYSIFQKKDQVVEDIEAEGDIGVEGDVGVEGDIGVEEAYKY